MGVPGMLHPTREQRHQCLISSRSDAPTPYRHFLPPSCVGPPSSDQDELLVVRQSVGVSTGTSAGERQQSLTADAGASSSPPILLVLWSSAEACRFSGAGKGNCSNVRLRMLRLLIML